MRSGLASRTGVHTHIVRPLALPLIVVLPLFALALAGCGDDESPAAPVGAPPVITMVKWTHDPSCTPNVPGGVTIEITATDADTDSVSLTYSGSVPMCGPITGPTTVVTCPQFLPYAASAIVRDPQGNSDTQGFTVAPCVNGQVTP